MVKYYRTDDRKIHEEPTIQDGVWVQMVNPSVAEGQMVADALDMDVEDVLAALDEDDQRDDAQDDQEDDHRGDYARGALNRMVILSFWSISRRSRSVMKKNRIRPYRLVF